MAKNLEALSCAINLRAGGQSINKAASILFMPGMVLVSLVSPILLYGLCTVGPSIYLYMHPAKENSMWTMFSHSILPE